MKKEWLEKLPKWKRIETVFYRWNDVLEKQVTFTLKDSEKHTKEHCRCVMAYALAIAQWMELSEKDKDILGTAAAFHDSRRQNDWYDVGHGQRAANYYNQFCRKSDFPYNECVYNLLYYHDRKDEAGIQAIKDKGGQTEKEIAVSDF